MSTETTPNGTGGAPEPQPVDDWQVRDRRVRRTVVSLLLLLVFVYLIPDIFYRVFPGEEAVVWHMLAGGTSIHVRDEGLRVKWPWDRAYIYDIRLQQETQTFSALSNDGLPIEVEVSVRFRPHKEMLGHLHKQVGPNYVETLVLPELGAHTREAISRYRPDELYGTRREAIQTEIREQLAEEMKLDYHLDDDDEETTLIYVEDVLIRNLLLPEEVADAISSKLSQEQAMLEYDYVLQVAKKEAERKAIEAHGIKAFQDIVSSGISERYLSWKGIDATLELARSDNSKIVVIGAGEGGLPIILGGLDSLSRAAAAAPATATAPAPPPAGTPPP